MGTVVRLRLLRRRPRKAAVPEGGAEILIFTGVRYERAAEPEPSPARGRTSRETKPRQARKRGRIAS
jgi:hypothetical protein